MPEDLNPSCDQCVTDIIIGSAMSFSRAWHALKLDGFTILLLSKL